MHAFHVATFATHMASYSTSGKRAPRSDGNAGQVANLPDIIGNLVFCVRAVRLQEPAASCGGLAHRPYSIDVIRAARMNELLGATRYAGTIEGSIIRPMNHANDL